ncbi:Na+/H+ antiporter subunit E [Arsukibacterium sp.]|uniref:Na+/H+ antiporter subunit E n=1 Tax=Arsukibacterium sp. TaxID=1977258 RepID=UPI002FD9A7F1
MSAAANSMSLSAVAAIIVAAALCWGALTAGRGWWFFLPLCLLLLLWCQRQQLTLPALRLRHLPGFVWYFSRQRVLGACDVALRALSPKLRLAPGWQHYQMRLVHAPSQRLLASMVSLLPGTCSVATALPTDNHHGDQHSSILLLHVLDTHANWQQGVLSLEQQLSQLLSDEPLLLAADTAQDKL